MVNKALLEEPIEGKIAFRFDHPNFRGCNSPNVKLEADISVAQESPENETKDDNESPDNRDKVLERPRLLERVGRPSVLCADASSMLFKSPNDSLESDSFSMTLLALFLFLRTNNEERPVGDLPNCWLAWADGASAFQSKFSVVDLRIPEPLLAWEMSVVL
jgi:hypothetical protein